MPSALGWGDLAGKRVGIFGAGLEGASALERLDDLTDDVVVVDDDPNATLPDHAVIDMANDNDRQRRYGHGWRHRAHYIYPWTRRRSNAFSAS